VGELAFVNPSSDVSHEQCAPARKHRRGLSWKIALQVVLYRDPAYFDKVAETTNAYVSPGLEKAFRICVAFEGNFGANSVTPRSLTAEFLGQMVAVEGIVTRCSLVRPKVVRSVHYCDKTVRIVRVATLNAVQRVWIMYRYLQKQFQAREYRDHTDMTGLPTGTSYPQEDDHGNRLETEFGLSVYKNSQTVTIQEMPESSPLGQLPRSVDCYLEHDLVDRVKPGDRITMVGMYRALSVTTAQATSGIFRTVILVNSVQRTSKETGVLQLSVGDVHNMRKLADTNDKNIFHLLARSLAPSIYGHKYVKQALALLLLGGVEHNLVNGTHIRGDINILMVGDPSTAKSQVCACLLCHLCTLTCMQSCLLCSCCGLC
jgi:DNA replication licensing factor MCM3